MIPHLTRSIDTPIRVGLSTDELWSGEDRGLILCWEKGREKATEDPELAARACNGELVETCWNRNSYNYVAYWQGLRGEDLDIQHSPNGFQTIVCAVTKRKVAVGPHGEKRDRLQAKYDRELLASKKKASQ